MANLTYSERSTVVSAILRLLDTASDFDNHPNLEDKLLIVEEVENILVALGDNREED